MSGASQVAILADDLIWADRLARAVRGAGAVPLPMRRTEDFAAMQAGVGVPLGAAPVAAVIVDLTARGYDALAAIGVAAALGVPILAVGQHDDHATRKRALAAGATRVLAYRKLHEDGPAVIAGWLAHALAPAPEPTR